MAIVTLPNIGGGSDPATINVSVLNGKVDPLATDYNGNIQNVNIAAGAGIVYSKLSLTDSIVNADISSSAAIVSSKLVLTALAQTVNWAKGSDIASATTTDIGAATGNVADVTGTTTITGLGTVQAGSFRVIQFDGALTLTHDAGALILPGGANITTAAGDVAGFYSLGSGNWKCAWYQAASGEAVVDSTPDGTVVAYSYAGSAANTDGSSTAVLDDTDPQVSELGLLLSRTHTPASATNILRIECFANALTGENQGAIVAIAKDSDAAVLSASMVSTNASASMVPPCVYNMVAGTTNEITFKMYGGTSTSTALRMNGIPGTSRMGSLGSAYISVTEIKAS